MNNDSNKWHSLEEIQSLGLFDEGVFSTSVDFQFVYINDKCLAMLGYSAAQLYGSHLRSLLVDPGLFEKIQISDVSQSAVPFEVQLICANGEKPWFEIRIVGDKSRGYLGRLTKINSLKEVQPKLQKFHVKNDILSLVAIRTASPVILTDAKGYIQWVNDGFSKVFGYAFNEVIGLKPGGLLQGKETDSSVIALMSHSIRDQQPFSVQVLNYCKNGEQVWVDIDCHPIFDHENKLINYIAIEIDQTANVMLQNKLKAAKHDAEAMTLAKDQLLASVSHEIRTPLSVILGAAQLLEQEPEGVNRKSILNLLKRATETLNSFIQDLLNYSSHSLGEIKLNLAAFSLRTVLHETIHMMQPIAKKNANQLQVSIPSHVPNSVIGDKVRLQQILMNLITNSAKFTEDGTININVDYLPSDNHVLQVEVCDTGLGIAEDEIAGIFEPLKQLTMKNIHNNGVGLGLAICKQICVSAGGEISVSSEKWNGTCFLVRLPWKTNGE